jgi:hypothetical protein
VPTCTTVSVTGHLTLLPLEIHHGDLTCNSPQICVADFTELVWSSLFEAKIDGSNEVLILPKKTYGFPGKFVMRGAGKLPESSMALSL